MQVGNATVVISKRNLGNEVAGREGIRGLPRMVACAKDARHRFKVSLENNLDPPTDFAGTEDSLLLQSSARSRTHFGLFKVFVL